MSLQISKRPRRKISPADHAEDYDRDPIAAAAEQITEVKGALKSAVFGLSGLLGSLKAARKEKRQVDKEIRSVRSTIRSLKKLDL